MSRHGNYKEYLEEAKAKDGNINFDEVYEQIEKDEKEKVVKRSLDLSVAGTKKFRNGMRGLSEEAKKAKEGAENLNKTISQMPKNKRRLFLTYLGATLSNLKTKKRLKEGISRTGLSEEELNKSKGLKQFSYGENSVWAINQKNADKKAKKLNYL